MQTGIFLPICVMWVAPALRSGWPRIFATSVRVRPSTFTQDTYERSKVAAVTPASMLCGRANGVPSRLMSSRRGDNDMGSRRALRAHSTHGFASRLEPQAAHEMVCGLRRKCRCASIAPAKARRRNAVAIAFKPW